VGKYLVGVGMHAFEDVAGLLDGFTAASATTEKE
jgi:hypothetical protein